MAAVSPVVSTVVMGVLLVAIVLAIARRGSPRGAQIASNRRYLPARSAERSGGAGTLLRASGSPTVWMAVFFLLVFSIGAGALLAVGGFGVEVPASVVMAVAGLFVVVLGGYLAVGIYYAARSRGHPGSMAVAEGVGTLALVAMLGIALRLVVV